MTKRKKPKAFIQQWNHLGVSSLQSAHSYLVGLKYYINETNDPSLLAMTGTQAASVLEFMDSWGIKHEKMHHALSERVRISELQGSYSQRRKRELRGEIFNPSFLHAYPSLPDTEFLQLAEDRHNASTEQQNANT